MTLRLRHFALAFLVFCLSAAHCGNMRQHRRKAFDGFLAQVSKGGGGARASPARRSPYSIAAQYDAGIIKRDRAQNVFAQSFLQFAGQHGDRGPRDQGPRA